MIKTRNFAVGLVAIVASLGAMMWTSAHAQAADDSAVSSLYEMGRGAYHDGDEGEAVEGSVVPTLSMEEQIKACMEDNDLPKMLLKVDGVQSDEGNVRVQIYGEDPEDFLKSGKKVTRVDVPSVQGEMQVCITFPQERTYAMAVLHDRNANGRVDILEEGFGFSNNPSLGFSPPDHDETAFRVSSEMAQMGVELTYIFDVEEKDRRRRRRR